MTEIHNVVAVTFADDASAYQGLSTLRTAAADGRIDLIGAAVVSRDAGGRLSIPEAGDTRIGEGIAGGGLIGVLVGILGGPLGMLIGWGTGALIGGVIDLDRASRGDELLAGFSRAVPPGSTALIAEVREPAIEVVDTEMGKIGGTVVRRPASEVLAELEAAEDASKAAEAEARRVVREQKKQAREEKFDERKAKLRARFGLDD
ncbi:DUF1269 domain-containing protein [Actinoplanes bogorensis]|uniref:DUF1269 domain-containing protein n=1 Tax=Paractinoplanes bogorensis TaxID=1610840 RepID=A0ABS5YK57_9ACTN|nr:DUF1269 domain-containing protein [Actinoplanes bogorensis]MBU2663869.1 DUF1269 domain-containing protein [Actinoplanes bogorensis]